MMEMVTLIGGIAGIVSIIMVIYGLGVSFGDLKRRVSVIEEKLIDPVEFGKLLTKVDFLYEFIVADKLRRSKNNPKSLNAEDKSIELPEKLVDIIKQKVLENLDKQNFEVVAEIFKELGTIDRNLRNQIMHKLT
ncbi:hypothetical protein CEE39_10025, partial [bacterium (candidate division B38) B3_B38]